MSQGGGALSTRSFLGNYTLIIAQVDQGFKTLEKIQIYLVLFNSMLHDLRKEGNNETAHSILRKIWKLKRENEERRQSWC